MLVGGQAQRGTHDDAPPRLLALRSQFGYVDDARLAMRDEPEAVPASYQERLADEAERRDREQRVTAWKSAHETIASVLRWEHS